MNTAERADRKLNLALIDREIAFDKVSHSGLMSAREQMELRSLLAGLCWKPAFKVEVEG